MRRWKAVLAALCLSSAAMAQIPDVIVKVDPLIHFRSEPGHGETIRAYDVLGHYGTVGLSFNLEPGFQVIVSQRLQKIRGNADDDQLDQLYIEDRGLWRVGKQLLPFGKNNLMRESVYAGQLQTTLGSEALPATLAVCDGGRGRQKGFAGRIGTRLGISFAIGEHFGIDASSFTAIRRPEDSPGRGRGYGQIIGVDYSRAVGNLNLRAEHVWLRDGNTAMDATNEVTDIFLSYEQGPDKSIGIGWARLWDDGEHEFRLVGKAPVAGNAWVEPIVLIRGGEVRATGVSLRVRF